MFSIIENPKKLKDIERKAKQAFDEIINRYHDEIISIFSYELTPEEKIIVLKYHHDMFIHFARLALSYRFKINENCSKDIKSILKEKLPATYNEYDIEVIYNLFVKYIRAITHFMTLLVFNGMLVDLDDDNVSISNGSLGTPGRIAKMYVGKNAHDLTEPLSGRFANEPELVTFPAKNHEKGMPVTVTVTLNAVCSHHLVRFGNEFGNKNSMVIISYIPDKKVIGLSKINRWVDYIARRGWLQEDLTSYIGKKLMEKADTKDVYVALINMQHGCVSFRGKNDTSAYTTTEFYSGKYSDISFRRDILKTVKQ